MSENAGATWGSRCPANPDITDGGETCRVHWKTSSEPILVEMIALVPDERGTVGRRCPGKADGDERLGVTPAGILRKPLALPETLTWSGRY